MSSLESLFGIWKLRSLLDVENGIEKHRDYKIEGRLIYAKPDSVFVGLTYHKPSGYSSSFYTGRFQLDGALIKHHIDFSSDEERNHTTLERRFSFEGESTLILAGKSHSGKSVKLIWEREK